MASQFTTHTTSYNNFSFDNSAVYFHDILPLSTCVDVGYHSD